MKPNFGPWLIKVDPGPRLIVADYEGRLVCDMNADDSTFNEAYRDACLIAQAPAMLELLKTIYGRLATYDLKPGDEMLLADLQLTIRKAERWNL